MNSNNNSSNQRSKYLTQFQQQQQMQQQLQQQNYNQFQNQQYDDEDDDFNQENQQNYQQNQQYYDDEEADDNYQNYPDMDGQHHYEDDGGDYDGNDAYNYDPNQQQVDMDYGQEEMDMEQDDGYQQQQHYEDDEDQQQLVIEGQETNRQNFNVVQYNNDDHYEDEEELDIQFEETPREESGFSKTQTQNQLLAQNPQTNLNISPNNRTPQKEDQQYNNNIRQNTQHDEEDEDDDNPMEKRLKKMKQQMRNQINTGNNANQADQEDNQGYDDYKSPQPNKHFTFNKNNQNIPSSGQEISQTQKPSQPLVQNTFRESAQIERDNQLQQQKLKEEQKTSGTSNNPSQNQLPLGFVGAANFDKIKNSKLFQKFMQKETNQKQQEPAANTKQPVVKQEDQNQGLKTASSKASLQQQKSPQNKKAGANNTQNGSSKNESPQTSAQRKGWQQNKAAENQPNNNQEKGPNQNAAGIEQLLNASNMTHDDYFEKQHKLQIFQTNQKLETSQNIGQQPQINNFMDDSQFFNNPLDQKIKFEVGTGQHIYGGINFQNDKNYLLDQSDFNNEGELVGYSEQIIGKINDMAPGIPNQDEVLIHQPPEAFVNLMHDQFNNEIQWLVGNKFPSTNPTTSSNPNLMKNQSNPNQGRNSNDLYHNNKPQPYDFQKVEPIRQDINQMREELHRMQADYDLANERFANLKEKYDKLQYDYNKDKQFYEEGLEARMNQLEQMETDNEQLQRKLEETRKQLLDQEGRNEQLEFDMSMLRKTAQNGTNERGILSKKEEQMNREISELQDSLRDKELEIESMGRDLNKMRGQLERANQETERVRQQLEYSEQTVEQKEQERQQLQNQIADMKMKMQQQQQEHGFLQEENQDLRNEVRLLNSKVNNANDVQESMRNQVYDLKDRVNELEHQSFLDKSSNEMMQKEIAQLRLQLQKANQFIQQQAQFYQSTSSSSLPTFSVPPSQPLNFDDFPAPTRSSRPQNSRINTQSSSSNALDDPTSYSRATRGGANNLRRGGSGFDKDEDAQSNASSQGIAWGSKATRESAVPKIQDSNNDNGFFNNDRNTVSGMSRKNQDKSNRNVNNFDETPINQGKNTIANKNRQQQLKSNEVSSLLQWSEQPQKSATNERPSRPIRGGQANVQEDSDMLSFNPQRQPPKGNIRVGQGSSNTVDVPNMGGGPGRKTQATAQQVQEFEGKQKQIQNIENNLMQLNIEKGRFKDEFDKIPENPKTIAQKRRKQELETELSILGKNIASLKQKLRDLGALQ